VYQSAVLSNGVRVWTANMPDTRSVSVGIFVGAGSRYEVDGLAGASHFLEHMLFKGTTRRPEPAMISGAIESVGGIMNAATDRELTVYWTKVAHDQFDLAIDLLSDMALSSTLQPKEVEKERMVILEELAMTNDHPDAKADQLMDETIWPSQPMGRDIGGSKESVSGISKADLDVYYRQQYVANNIVVAVAGNVSHQTVVDAVQEHMGALHPGSPLDWFRVKEASGPKISLEWRKTDQAHLCLAFPGVSNNDERRYALDLLNTILGEGMTSRLFMEVRERQGLAYDVHSSSMHYRDTGAVVLYCGTDPTKVDNALSAILGELDRLRRKGVVEEELRRAAQFATGRLLLRMEDTRAVMSSMGAQEMLLDRVKTPDEVAEGVRSVTVEQVRQAAERFLVPDAFRMAVVGPYRSTRRFEKQLASV